MVWSAGLADQTIKQMPPNAFEKLRPTADDEQMAVLQLELRHFNYMIEAATQPDALFLPNSSCICVDSSRGHAALCPCAKRLLYLKSESKRKLKSSLRALHGTHAEKPGTLQPRPESGLLRKPLATTKARPGVWSGGIFGPVQGTSPPPDATQGPTAGDHSSGLSHRVARLDLTLHCSAKVFTTPLHSAIIVLHVFTSLRNPF